MGRPPKKEVPCVHGVFSQFSQHHPMSENKKTNLGHIGGYTILGPLLIEIPEFNQPEEWKTGHPGSAELQASMISRNPKPCCFASRRRSKKGVSYSLTIFNAIYTLEKEIPKTDVHLFSKPSC